VKGRIVSVFGNMVIAETEGDVVKNSVGFCHRRDGVSLLCEIIRIRGSRADLQVFEETRGLRVGDRVEFRPEMLSATLGPGLLGQVYDGLQKPLPRLAEKTGYFLTPGSDMPALDTERQWEWTPRVRAGDTVLAGDALGSVPEGIFDHPIMVPFAWSGEFVVEAVMGAGAYTIDDAVAVLTDAEGHQRNVAMQQTWPVKRPLCVARTRIMPTEPLVTRVRIIDSMFPIVRGGTYCIPGPFGAGKTILQQVTSRNAEVDIVIITACGERAGEVVETIREFPKLEDPRTGRRLMERTIIVCNTSAMPVAARDASVYTGITLAEYYRQAGLHVLLLADSTSRWAQAMREISGRLEEIPGEEAFPAYLESRIAGFYERAGMIQLRNGKRASVTIGGTVSPAGGNFDEPVTQATLKVAGAFHGLSRERSDARRYPAIDPTDSWSKYQGIIEPEKRAWVQSLLRRSEEVRQMITVVGEEGTPMEDFTLMLKADFFDAAYLQQNAFDAVDGATPRERQRFVFDKILEILHLSFGFKTKDQAREVMVRISSLFRDWNYLPWDPGVLSPNDGLGEEAERSNFRALLNEIDHFIESRGEMAGEGKEREHPEENECETKGLGGPEDDEESQHSGLGESIKCVRTDARPRSRKTLSGECPGWDDEDCGA
jgi:V/A-type H+/Na+-transporting ATPase subunit A